MNKDSKAKQEVISGNGNWDGTVMGEHVRDSGRPLGYLGTLCM